MIFVKKITHHLLKTWRKTMKKTILTAVLMTVSAVIFAQSAREIVDAALKIKKPSYNHSMVEMDLINKAGNVEEHRLIDELGRHNAETDTSDVVMNFKSSTNKSNQGIKFLQMENKGKDDDKWIYMPSLKTTRRVNSSEGSKSFTGTDASYDDMSTRELDDDLHELLGEENKNGYDCWKIKSTPTAETAGKAQYQYRIQWIDKKTKVPVYVEMYDKKDGTLVKVLTVDSIENIQGYTITTATTLKNVKSGHSTRIAAQKNPKSPNGYNIILDKPIPDSVFTQNYLNTAK